MHDTGRDQTEERKAENGSVACNALETFVSASVRIGRKERGAAATRAAARPKRRVRTPRVIP
jgi:hypothetical protein